MAGRVDGNVRWQRSRDDQVAADGKLKLTDFELSTTGQQPWRERELTLDLAGAAALQAGQIQRVLSASVQVHSGSDVLKTDLLQPVATAGPATAWPLGLKATGNLATWLPRLRPFVPLGDRRLTGTSTWMPPLACQPKGRRRVAKLQIDQFQFASGIPPSTNRRFVGRQGNVGRAQGRVTRKMWR
jgi:hypothetical protein